MSVHLSLRRETRCHREAGPGDSEDNYRGNWCQFIYPWRGMGGTRETRCQFIYPWRETRCQFIYPCEAGPGDSEDNYRTTSNQEIRPCLSAEYRQFDPGRGHHVPVCRLDRRRERLLSDIGCHVGQDEVTVASILKTKTSHFAWSVNVNLRSMASWGLPSSSAYGYTKKFRGGPFLNGVQIQVSATAELQPVLIVVPEEVVPLVWVLGGLTCVNRHPAASSDV